jgi:hypothetical protein
MHEAPPSLIAAPELLCHACFMHGREGRALLHAAGCLGRPSLMRGRWEHSVQHEAGGNAGAA